jgi:enediyne biosynthesis protein CalE5
MEDAARGADAFKAQMAAQWSAVAQGWRKRWPVFERDAQPLSDRMMELAQIGPNMRVLDVATGIGEPALTAARRVGPGGSVVAVDQAPEMLAVARERIQSAGVNNVEFIEADAETFTPQPGAYDAVVSRWAIMFFADPAGTLARLRVGLVPGGRFVATVWGQPQQVPIIVLSFKAMAGEQGQTTPPGPAGPGPFSFADAAALEAVARQAGFTDVRSEQWTMTSHFASMDELIGHIEDISAPVRAMLAMQPPERQAAFRTRFASAAASYVAADGSISLPNGCLIVTGVA